MRIVLPGPQIKEYFATARMRYDILLRRNAGQPRPWTTDSAFGKYRFCNVFREDDETTKLVRKYVRDPLDQNPQILTALVAARLFNHRSVIVSLAKAGLFVKWNSRAARKTLKDYKSIVGAAYKVRTPAGLRKLEGICAVVDMSIKPSLKIMAQIVPGQTTLEEAWREIKTLPFIGDFLAYEIVTDLRHTAWLRNAPDIMSWAALGPGAIKGLSWLSCEDLRALKYKKQKTHDAALDAMQRLLVCSTNDDFWPRKWQPWEMREVEHWLCEYGKWVRVHYLGRPAKRRWKLED